MPKEVAEAHGGKELLKTGASLLVSGTLTETPADVKNLAQAVELKADKVLFFGPCDPKTYPIAKKKHGMEFLREKAHLRPRTNVIGAVARIRSQLAYATHQFFQGHGFLYVHTPIITASDCEGAGEMFQVTTLLAEAERRSAEAAASGADQREAGHSATNDAQAQVRS
jgi:asparaginyl-tRNA synthetase